MRKKSKKHDALDNSAFEFTRDCIDNIRLAR